MPNREQITVYVTKEAKADRLQERAKAIAEEKRRSLNWVLLEAIRSYVEREEAK